MAFLGSGVRVAITLLSQPWSAAPEAVRRALVTRNCSVEPIQPAQGRLDIVARLTSGTCGVRAGERVADCSETTLIALRAWLGASDDLPSESSERTQCSELRCVRVAVIRRAPRIGLSEPVRQSCCTEGPVRSAEGRTRSESPIVASTDCRLARTVNRDCCSVPHKGHLGTDQ